MQDDSLQDDIYKMIVFKKIQFARLQATSKSAMITNLKKLPSPHKLLQGAPAKSVEGGVKISKTCLPPVCPLCLPKILEEGLYAFLKSWKVWVVSHHLLMRHCKVAFAGEQVEPLHHLIGASPTSIRGWWLQKRRDVIRFMIQVKFEENDIVMHKWKWNE